ncbi:MAG TPA: lipid A deacylase LpxR family protein [Desulfobacteraceae bacterium]|nr:lipid A deacylase LpxR family protein [Desulfobacteraceae bacterium]
MNINMNKLAGLFLLLLTGLVSPYMVWGAGSAKNGTLSLVVENDVFYDIDQHYTNGVRLNWVPSRDSFTPEWAVKAARLVPWFPEQGEIRHGYAIGQSMFTPSDISIANPPLRERPYAGWLYGTIGLAMETGKQLDQFALTIGMVGPASLAEQTQKFVHKLIDSDDPKGWDTQLHNELGIVMTCQRSLREFATATFLGNQLDFTPHAGVAIGNVFSYCNAGLTIRYGEELPKDYGPPRIQPGLPGSGDFSPVTDFGWYIFAGIEGRVVARNIFLDGNTFRDSRSVDKKYLVGDLQFGIVLDWSNIRLSYTHIIRTHEFRTQDSNDDFGAITVSVKF